MNNINDMVTSDLREQGDAMLSEETDAEADKSVTTGIKAEIAIVAVGAVENKFCLID